ncbi:MAG: glycosyltransferase family 2 protein [Candidatus Solibacter sp.]|nr:glycosyltransferase family 2 protein [Candidatus Solibacter sp.]
MPEPTVCISIVTFNSSRYIRRCLNAALAQRGVRTTVMVVDNASADGTGAILQEFGSRIQVIWNRNNVGFAEAQNQGMRASRAEWVLTLNPDLLMEEDFVRRLVDAGELDRGAGAVCGKLLSIGVGFQPLAERRIDSTGLFFTPTMRHFDRGWHEPDDGAYDRAEYVFGACAAAALYRRQMIDDVSIRGDFFDPDFFAYREDADVAWRAQLLGWRCIYTPAAVGWHVRSVVPGKRRSITPSINMHSVKNRFLMRIKNATPGLYRHCWLPMTVRDLVVVSGCLLLEPRSLPAFWQVAKCWPATWQRRREIMRRRRVSDGELMRWFRFELAGEPLTGEAVAETAPRMLAPDAA